MLSTASGGPSIYNRVFIVVFMRQVRYISQNSCCFSGSPRTLHPLQFPLYNAPAFVDILAQNIYTLHEA
jgi:hypothetical protein